MVGFLNYQRKVSLQKAPDFFFKYRRLPELTHSFIQQLFIDTYNVPGTILYAGAQAVWKTHGGPILEDLICAQGKCVCHVLINAIKRQ